MKKIKKHWLITFVLILVVMSIINYSNRYVENMERNNRKQQEFITNCQNGTIENKEFCEQVMNDMDIHNDFYTMMTDVLVFGIRFINPTAFILVVFPTLVNLCRILKRKYILNALTRQSYKEFLVDFLKTAYKYIWLLPLIAIIIISICIMNTSIHPSISLQYDTSMWYAETIKHPILFILLYILNIMIYSFSFINLALMIVRKHHNLIVATILSILIYVGIELFFELVINNLLFGLVFKSELGYLFNIMNIFTFSDQFGILTLLLFSFSMLVLSCIGVYVSYRKKENLVIACEKNH